MKLTRDLMWLSNPAAKGMAGKRVVSMPFEHEIQECSASEAPIAARFEDMFGEKVLRCFKGRLYALVRFDRKELKAQDLPKLVQSSSFPEGVATLSTGRLAQVRRFISGQTPQRANAHDLTLPAARVAQDDALWAQSRLLIIGGIVYKRSPGVVYAPKWRGDPAADYTSRVVVAPKLELGQGSEACYDFTYADRQKGVEIVTRAWRKPTTLDPLEIRGDGPFQDPDFDDIAVCTSNTVHHCAWVGGLVHAGQASPEFLRAFHAIKRLSAEDMIGSRRDPAWHISMAHPTDDFERPDILGAEEALQRYADALPADRGLDYSRLTAQACLQRRREARANPDLDVLASLGPVQ